MYGPLIWGEEREAYYCFLVAPNNQCWEVDGYCFALERVTLHGLKSTLPEPPTKKHSTIMCNVRVSPDGEKILLLNKPKALVGTILERTPSDE